MFRKLSSSLALTVQARFAIKFSVKLLSMKKSDSQLMTFDWLISSPCLKHFLETFKLSTRGVQTLGFQNFDKREKMFSFKIKSPVTGLSKQHLHEYQAGEAVGYTVDCKDGSFQVHKWCLYNSDFLLTMHKGMSKFMECRARTLRLTNTEIYVANGHLFRINQSSQKF